MDPTPTEAAPLSHDWIPDSNFFHLLDAEDARVTAAVKAAGCPDCGGRLDQANYPRKPRGGDLAAAGEIFRAAPKPVLCARWLPAAKDAAVIGVSGPASLPGDHGRGDHVAGRGGDIAAAADGGPLASLVGCRPGYPVVDRDAGPPMAGRGAGGDLAGGAHRAPAAPAVAGRRVDDDSADADASVRRSMSRFCEGERRPRRSWRSRDSPPVLYGERHHDG